MDAPTPEPKRLYRSRKQRVIAGVCGGLAEYFNVDPVWMRLIFIVFTLIGFGLLLLIYIIFIFIVPNAPLTAADENCPTCKK